MGWGLLLLSGIPNPAGGKQHFGGSALALTKLSILGWQPFPGSQTQIYVGFVALTGNLVVAVLVTIVLRQMRVVNGIDETNPSDYYEDEGSLRLKPVAGALPTPSPRTPAAGT
jgi:SSS family solute:Na+ symporter